MYPAPPKLQPALYGGLFIGVLSALPFVNVCCCLWMVSGGAIAVYLMQQNHAYPITAADGALVGLLAGLVGAVVSGLLSIPINMAMGPLLQQMVQGWIVNNPEIPSETKSMVETMLARSSTPTVIGTILGIFMSMLVGSILALLGGLLGVALFKKKDTPPPPGTVEVLPPL
jgi:uncharacterized membrane protein YedE/YeeE